METFKNSILVWVLIMIALFFTFKPTEKEVYRVAETNCGGLEKVQWVQMPNFWGGYGFGCMPK